MVDVTGLGRKSGYYSYGGGSNSINITDTVTTTANVIDLSSWYSGLSTYSYRYKLDAGGGADTINGNAANDYLIGGAGGDTLTGGGGDDLILGGLDGNAALSLTANETDVISGDSYSGTINSTGGNDIIFAAKGTVFARSLIFGDSGDAIGAGGRGGNDYIIGGNGDMTAYGDAAGLSLSDTSSAFGGNDVIVGSSGYSASTRKGPVNYLVTNNLYGDAYDFAAATTGGRAIGGNDTITGGDNAVNNVFGDGYILRTGSVGGDDTLTGGGRTNSIFRTANYLTGDAQDLFGAGGNDVLIGGDSAFTNRLVGDAYNGQSTGVGGNDTLIGGTNSRGFNSANYLYGDAISAVDGFTAGNDSIVGGTNTGSIIYGDAYDATISTSGVTLTGGNDVIVVPGTNSTIYGDFDQIYVYTTGVTIKFGNDSITGGNGDDNIYGDYSDVQFGEKILTGGDDTIAGGKGADWIYGGIGNDTFVYAQTSDSLTGLNLATAIGNDTIIDFTSSLVGGNDHIVLSATGFGLSSTAGAGFSDGSDFAVVATNSAVDGSSARIVFSQETSTLYYNASSGASDYAALATLNNVTNLAASDFIIVT